MSPQKHLIIGMAGASVAYGIWSNTLSAIGFLAGSLIIDLDHFWIFWRETNFSRIFDVKGMMDYSSRQKLKRFIQRPFLHLVPFHTFEFLLSFWTVLYIFSISSPLFTGLLIGMLFHILADDLELFRVSSFSFHKRAHSIIEYYVRQMIFKEQTYQDIYPPNPPKK